MAHQINTANISNLIQTGATGMATNAAAREDNPMYALMRLRFMFHPLKLTWRQAKGSAFRLPPPLDSLAGPLRPSGDALPRCLMLDYVVRKDFGYCREKFIPTMPSQDHVPIPAIGLHAHRRLVLIAAPTGGYEIVNSL